MKVQALSNTKISGVRILFVSSAFFLLHDGSTAQTPVAIHTYTFPQGVATLGSLLNAVEQTSDTSFAYDKDLLDLNLRVNVPPGNSIEEVIKPAMEKHGFEIVRGTSSTISIRPKAAVTASHNGERAEKTFNLTVISPEDEPLDNATVSPFEGPRQTGHYRTNKSGFVSFKSPQEQVTVNISHVNMLTQSRTISHQDTNRVIMLRHSEMLTAVEKGYSNRTKATSTGNHAIVTNLGNAPAGSPLFSGLYGRVPGLDINQTSGFASASQRINIRGINSLVNGSDPLIIIDGVPFPSNNQSVSSITTGNSGGSLSGFCQMDPNIIDTFELLKDADATAIYGSRGANGVILITTKYAKTKKLKFTTSVSTITSAIAQRVRMMNNSQYLQMRENAFRLDGLPIKPATAPDVFLADTTRSNDWQKQFIGTAAPGLSMQSSISGGGRKFNYLAGLTAFRIKNAFITQPVHENFNAYTNFHATPLRGLSINTNMLLGIDRDHQFQRPFDPTNDIFMVPFAPPLPQQLDANNRPLANFGNAHDSAAYLNPNSTIRRTYTSWVRNALLSAVITYHLSNDLSVTNTIGWDGLLVKESAGTPDDAYPAQIKDQGLGSSAQTIYTSLIEEPHLEYKPYLGSLSLSLLAGFSFQHFGSRMQTKDTTEVAGPFDIESESARYDYHAQFARASFSWNNRYSVNATTRRDRSSRLPESSSGVFYSIGAAWIFSNEPFIERLLPMLSFGKLRASWGKTGSDQIGAGHYLTNYAPNIAANFPNIPGWPSGNTIGPGQTFETIYKSEAGLELGFIKDRLLLTATYYRNRSSNQLLPDSNDVWWNVPCKLENTGWEFSLDLKVFKKKNISWDLSLNLSLPSNRLLSFPGLPQFANFKDALIVGQPLNAARLYKYSGVDVQTGLYKFEDPDHDGQYTVADQTAIKGTSTRVFGGIQNTIIYKRLKLAFNFDFKVRTATSSLFSILRYNQPGTNTIPMYSNMPAWMADYWKNPGDQTAYQRVSTSRTSLAGQRIDILLGSDYMFVDGSFFRLRQITLSYELPHWIFSSASVFANAHNLFTITGYKGFVETEDIRTLPPLRIFESGIRVSI